MAPVRVLIADDHRHFRDGLRALLQFDGGIEVVGEAGTGGDVIRLATALQLDVILMDLQMPGINGIEATRHILYASPHMRILVISMFEDDDSVFAALQAGARGYLLKGALKAEILRDPGRRQRRGDLRAGDRPARDGLLRAPRLVPPPQAFPELTEREREILALVAQHLTNPEIAARLRLSSKTVRNHVSNIFDKLQVADRAEAIIRAREAAKGTGNTR